MNIGIIIYSKTGNTLSVAERLEEAFKAKGYSVMIDKVVPENDDDRPITGLKSAPDVKDFDAIIFAAPVHAFSLAPAMKMYLGQVGSLSGKLVYCFVTQHLKKAWMGGNRALRTIKSACKAKGSEAIISGLVNWSAPIRDEQIDDIVSKLSSEI